MEKTEYLCEIGEYWAILMWASEKPRSIFQRKTNAEPPVDQSCAPRLEQSCAPGGNAAERKTNARPPVNQSGAPKLEQSGAPGENAADMEGCDEAAAERKRAERSFATAAGRVLRPCGLREG